MAWRLEEGNRWSEEEASPVHCDTIPEESLSRPGPGEEILIMSVDLGNGRSGRVVVHERDDAGLLAREFCQRQELPEDLVQPLKEQIVSNVVKLGMREERGSETQRTVAVDKKRTNAPTDTRKSSERKLARPSSSAASSQFSHPGERLYAQAHKHRETARLRTRHLQKSLDSETAKELTFSPKLNEQSVELAERRRGRKGSVDSSLLRTRGGQESAERIRKALLERETSECTFTPSIDPISQLIVSSMHRSSSAERYLSLHEDAERRKRLQTQVARSYVREVCPFQPTLVAKQIPSAEPPLYLRLVDANKPRSAAPPLSHPSLFHPITGRSPKHARKPNHTPIGDYLYSLRCKPQPAPPRDSPVPSSTNNASQKLLQRKRQVRYKDLFAMLQPDDQMEISFDRIKQKELDSDLLGLLKPLLDEMESLKVTLDFSEFEEAMDALVRTLDPRGKARLLGYSKKDQPANSQASHKPQTTPYKCSQRVQRLLQVPLYDRWKEGRRDVQAWREAEKLRKEALELEECSFQPKIRPYYGPSDLPEVAD